MSQNPTGDKMSGLKYYERTKLLIELIDQKKTGRPEELAHKIGVSKRMVYLIIDDLRLTLGREICYKLLSLYFTYCR
jgi:transcriptional antiterminator